MALTSAQRMARMRARQHGTGLTTVTLVVPQSDSGPLRRLAARRRSRLALGQAQAAGNLRLERNMLRDAAAHRISPSDILETRQLLEVAAVSLVVRALNPWSVRRLRAALADEAALNDNTNAAELQRFHLLLGELSGDAALLLFLRLSLLLTDQHSIFTRLQPMDRAAVVAHVRRLHAGIAAAILDRKEGLAIRRMRRYVSGLKDWLV